MKKKKIIKFPFLKNYEKDLFFISYTESLKETLNQIDFKKVKKISDTIFNVIKKNKQIFVAGNGGSASDSNHLAGELTCTFSDKNRTAINAISLVSNPSVISAWSNDVDFEFVFSRQIEALKNTLGLAIGLSTSGKSKNVLSNSTCDKCLPWGPQFDKK